MDAKTFAEFQSHIYQASGITLGESKVSLVLARIGKRLRALDLATPPFPMQRPLDIVMRRNVMIYFDNTVRQNLLNEIYHLLKPGGYLMVGHAESPTGLTTKFKTIQPSLYQKVH